MTKPVYDFDTWPSTSAEDRLKMTDFIVEATRFEMVTLWERWFKNHKRFKTW